MLTKVKETLNAYSEKDLQHFIQLLNKFESIGSDIPTSRNAVQEVLNIRMAHLRSSEGKRYQRERAMKAREQIVMATRNKSKTCAVCGSLVQILSVNDSPGTMVKGPWKSVIHCSSCLNQEFSEKSVEEYL